MSALTAILIGAGDRGARAYASYALEHADEIRFIAVAEPNLARRERFAQTHGIPAQRCYPSWEDLLNEGKIADVALVCTMDHLHTAPTRAALQAGYDVLLEKPMATTLGDCVELVELAEKSGRLLQICHVLRYTTFFSKLHEILESGRLGQVITVEHRENVVYWHMAHSYVRGHWRNSTLECPMILAKCCHDLDILYWNLGAVRRLSSNGSLMHFRAENAPPGAPKRCTDGCPAAQECPWYAPHLYLELEPLYRTALRSTVAWERAGARLLLDHPKLAAVLKRLIPPFAKAADYRGWPVSVISEDDSYEGRRKALETGPWGRCIYHCDNDVVDHQVIIMELESGASVTLTMQGHSHQEGRTMRYDGTRATLRGKFGDGLDDQIEIHDHYTRHVERIPLRRSYSGHGGGDAGLMAAFIKVARGEFEPLTSAREALESHLMAFAAEQSRLQNAVVDMDVFRNEMSTERNQ